MKKDFDFSLFGKGVAGKTLAIEKFKEAMDKCVYEYITDAVDSASFYDLLIFAGKNVELFEGKVFSASDMRDVIIDVLIEWFFERAFSYTLK